EADRPSSPHASVRRPPHRGVRIPSEWVYGLDRNGCTETVGIRRRELTADGAALDVGRIEAALTRARQALTRHQSARSCFSVAAKKIDEGTGHVGVLVEEVRSALSDLWEELSSG
ncbi:MAG: hypothetical protein ACRD6W_06645, partial [Nitrososphaerales archaeon]